MKLIPVNDRITVQPLPPEEQGLIIPDSVRKETPEEGTVLATGPKVEGVCKAGDRIVFKKYAPDKVKLGEEEVLVISAEDVLGVVKQD